MPGRPSTVGAVTPGRPSTVAVAEVDRRRRAAGVSVARLAGVAGVDPRTLARLLNEGRAPRPATAAKLEAALDRLAGTAAPAPDLVRRLHTVVTVLVAQALGADPAAVLRTDTTSVQRPFDRAWMESCRVKRIATALLILDLGVSRAAAARALDQTRQAVHQTLGWISEQSEASPEFATLMARLGAAVTGR